MFTEGQDLFMVAGEINNPAKLKPLEIAMILRPKHRLLNMCVKKMSSVKLLLMLRMAFLYFLFQSSWKRTIPLWQNSMKLITLGKCA